MLLVLGILAVLTGLVWFFQGIGVLPGSFMTGQGFWAVMGIVSGLVGVILIALSRRR